MKKTFINFSIIAVAILLSILTYSKLSPEIAIHWTNGEVNRTLPKLLGVGSSVNYCYNDCYL